MNWTNIFSLLVAIASSTVISQGVQAFMQRRKVSADAVETLSDTAIAQVAAMEARMIKAEESQEKMRTDQREFRKALREHEKWDRSVISKLAGLGVVVDDAPELWL